MICSNLAETSVKVPNTIFEKKKYKTVRENPRKIQNAVKKKKEKTFSQ